MLDIPFHYLVESFAKIKKEFSRNSHGKKISTGISTGYEKFPGGSKQHKSTLRVPQQHCHFLIYWQKSLKN